MDERPDNRKQNRPNKAAVRQNRKRLQEQMVELLLKASTVSGACAKVGISRMTHNRWMRTNAKYREAVKEALVVGDETVSDMAESKLKQLIQDGNFPAIRYYLSRRSPRYPEPPSEKMNVLQPPERVDLSEHARKLAEEFMHPEPLSYRANQKRQG